MSSETKKEEENLSLPKAEPLSREEELKAIKKQVEFYFGDSNFSRDKFLKAQAALSQGGFIPLKTILSFKRMRDYTLENTLEALASSTIVELSADKSGVRRALPVAEDDTAIPRTIYVKGWPKTTTIEDVEKFFAPHGTVLSVRLRRLENKDFKGSLFVEFATEDEALSVLNKKPQIPETVVEIKKDEAGPSETAILKRTLLYMTKGEWTQEKHEELQRHRTTIQKRKQEENDEKKKKKAKKEEERLEEEKKREEKEKERANRPIRPGLILKFGNIPPGQNCYTLKAIFEIYGAVRHVDYKKDEPTGYIRFLDPRTPLELIKGFTDKKTQIGDKTPTFELVTGDEEKAYWDTVTAAIAAKEKEQKGKKGFKGGKGGRGGKTFRGKGKGKAR
eukprot:TRINITY_DN1481_c0_g1_i1.p1 TRINITY_DN1481_c0_g1~~TRINITY_DN1481_c0_g1_i1.p1  ORF type:complete len:391 (-),score=123.99 TRINITY_DN1481_c0_g1_i1:257-1429(-)